jgi:hypothetical protein
MLRRGVYHVFIKDYLKVFPRDHVHIQRLEDISDDPEGTLIQTYKFLDLSTFLLFFFIFYFMIHV